MAFDVDYTFLFNSEPDAQSDPFVGQYCQWSDDGDGNMVRYWDMSICFPGQMMFNLDTFEFEGGFRITISLTEENTWFEQHPNLILKSTWEDGVGTKVFVAEDHLPFKDHMILFPVPWGRNVNDLDDPGTGMMLMSAKSAKKKAAPKARKTFTLPIRPTVKRKP